MILDIILLAIIFVWAVFGYRKGFIQQIFVFIGVLAVALGAAPLADIAEKIISEEFDVVLVGRYTKMLLLAGCAATIFIITTLVGRFLHNTLVQGIPMAEKTNHVLGAVIGIVSSFIIIVFILGVCAAGNSKIDHYAPSVAQFLNISTSYQIVLQNNPVLAFDFFKEYKSGTQSSNVPENASVKLEDTSAKSGDISAKSEIISVKSEEKNVKPERSDDVSLSRAKALEIINKKANKTQNDNLDN